MIRILIADDHAVVRQGLKQIIADEADMQIVGEAEKASEVLNFIHQEDLNVIILDITMPGKSGLDLLPEIRNLRPMIKILILIPFPIEKYAIAEARTSVRADSVIQHFRPC